MAIDVRVRARTPLAVSGFTSTGAVSNTKTMIQGDIDITVYTADGEPVTPRDLGLENIDALFLSVVDVDGTVASVSQVTNAVYDHTAEQILLWDGNTGDTIAGSNGQVRFLAFGDSAAAPELT